MMSGARKASGNQAADIAVADTFCLRDVAQGVCAAADEIVEPSVCTCDSVDERWVGIRASGAVVWAVKNQPHLDTAVLQLGWDRIADKGFGLTYDRRKVYDDVELVSAQLDTLHEVETLTAPS